VTLSNSTEDNQDFLKCSKAIVQFWAPWCGPCNNCEELNSISIKNNLKIFRINIEENPQLKIDNYIIMVPTYIIYENGKEIKRYFGNKDLSFLKRKGK